ncbi:MAG: c-type cytochrome [Chitinophagaceae bacterium]
MKYFLPGLLFMGLLSASFSSCYYDKEELLYGISNQPCTDTSTTASYSQKILPVFRQFCYGCHTGSFPSGGIVMGTYQADKALGSGGRLYGSVSHASGYSPMPKGMSKMTSCQIAAIKTWIDTGMPNN